MVQTQIEPATRLRGPALAFARLTWGALVLTILIAFSVVTEVSLSDHLLAVVDETMQPTRVSWWLKRTERGEK